MGTCQAGFSLGETIPNFYTPNPAFNDDGSRIVMKKDFEPQPPEILPKSANKG
jgi:hypothetical protein